MEPEIGQVIVHGDRRAFLVALVVPAPELLKEVARAADGDATAAAAHPDVERRIDAAIKRANGALGPVERIRRFAVVPEPFSVENGLMTPTMKLRRRLIYERERALLERLHAGQRVEAA
jgi:long-chain acyl-CoA synthetase